MITSHAFGTSTSRIVFRFNFLVIDREPTVATSLTEREGLGSVYRMEIK